MTKTIKVTKTGIRKGIAGDCSGCPVARGLKTAGLKKVKVNSDIFDFQWRKHRYIVHVPQKVRNFIDIFDGVDIGLTTEPKPFNFQLRFTENNIYDENH